METKVYTNSAVSADFIYDDSDDYENEIAELYSYAEDKNFQQNFSDFQIEVQLLGLSPLEWCSWDDKMKSNFVMKMVDQLEYCNCQMRMRAAHCILYLAQGCWVETKSIVDQQDVTRKNVRLLCDAGVFHSMISLLNMELEKAENIEKDINEKDETEIKTEKTESDELKVIFDVLYTILETIRFEKLKKNSEFKDIIEECINDISYPLADGSLLAVKLFNMISKFCDGSGAHFPIKKILLLLWKTSLLSLGSTSELLNLKNDVRTNLGLPAFQNDTLSASKQMQATILCREDTSTARKFMNSGRRPKGLWEVICENVDISRKSVETITKFKKTNWNNDEDTADIPEMPMKFENSSGNNTSSVQNCLLFKPKVRSKDIELFLQNVRQKYFGYVLENDNETLIGLPLPVQDSVQALKRHLYVSLSERQIEEEQKEGTILFSQESVDLKPVEILYQALLPHFRKYITDLLRILLASSPSAKLTIGSLNSRIVADMLPKSQNSATIFSTTVQTDLLRHKEIIVKTITAIMLLYLKHFKINHVNQFEFLAQLLAQSSFIKLALQVFAPIIPEYVSLKSSIARREFPLCVIEQFHEDYTSEHNYMTNSVADLSYSWRNLFSCINILRIVNKLVKWKNSRILNMVSLKSAGSLKEALQIRQPLLQIYILKLLKMQARYLGRYWRRNNLKVMTAIYTKVRHRFNDDWAYGCDTVAKFWNAQEEEVELRKRVMQFHNRQYPDIKLDYEFINEFLNLPDKNVKAKNSKTDEFNYFPEEAPEVKSENNDCGNCKEQRHNSSLVNNKIKEESNEEELPEEFKQNYEAWLEHQVYSNNFDWDSV